MEVFAEQKTPPRNPFTFWQKYVRNELFNCTVLYKLLLCELDQRKCKFENEVAQCAAVDMHVGQCLASMLVYWTAHCD